MDSITIRAARRDPRATATHRMRCAMLSAAWLVGMHVAQPASAAIGRTAGIADVTRHGEASYVIPIRPTPGIAGLTPELAIGYGAPNARGILGAGFTLTGLSAITPCPRTIAQDGEAAPVTLTTADVYCVDGQRLRLVSGIYGASNAQYRTEIDRAMRVTSLGGGGKQPTYFRIERSNGLLYEYGNSTDSRARSSSSAAAVTFIWALNRVADRNGNSIVFRYENDPATGLFRPNYIDYTATAAGPAQYRIDFVYQALDRPDPIESSTSSSAEPATLAEKRLLSRIDLKYQGARYRKYLLSYETGPNRASRLVSLQECTDLSSECFEPTRFTWQSSTAGYDAPIASAATVALPAWPLDFNGDGYDDLVWAQGGTWRTMTGSVIGYGVAVNTGTAATNPAAAMPLEWNGDGRDDLLVQWSDGTWRVLRGTANGLAAPVAAGASPVIAETTSSWTVADLDGDGRDDLVRASSNGRRFSARLNTDTGFTSEGLYAGVSIAATPNAFPASTHGTTDSRRVDFDNDGREDFAIRGCQWDFETSRCMTDTAWWTFLSNGSTLVSQGMLYLSANGGAPVFGDFNADRLTDLVYARTDGTIAVALSRGGVGFTFVPGPATTGYVASELRVEDYDGDGYDDLLIASNPSAGASWWYVFRGTGNGISSTAFATSVPGLNTIVTDVTGDGLADLARAGSGNGAWTVHPRLGVPGDLLVKATDGFGATAEWTRAPMSSTSIYRRGTGAVYPVTDVGGSRPLVSSLRQSDGSGASATFMLSFEYEGAREHRQGRGNLGFAARITHDDRLNDDLERKETWLQTFPHIGLPAAQTLRRRDGSLMSEEIDTWSSIVAGTPLASARRLPFLAGVVQRDYSSTGVVFRTTTRTVAAIDPTSGLSLDETTTVTENATGVAPGSSRTARVLHTAVLNDTASWCIGRPTATQITTSHTAAGAAVTRAFTQTWDDAMCRVTQQQVQPGDAKLQVTRTYAYDAFGNVASEKVAGVGMPARTTSIDWSATGQFPAATTNALSQTATMTWDAELAVPLTARDPNLLTTTWTYDGFGRLVSELRPDQTSTTWSRAACSSCDPRTEYQLIESAVDASGAVSWSSTRELDRYERTWKVANEMPGGGESITMVDFDAKGRLSARRLPIALGGPDAGQWRYTYDEWDRLRSEQLRRPGGSVDRSISYEYDGLQVTVTDPLGNATVATASAWGDIVRVTDATNRTTDYEYNALGQPTRVVDPSGNQLMSITYNVRGMKTAQTDMDLGAWTIEPNALGEVVRFRDARTPGPGWTTVHTYDLLGRLTSREDVAEGVTATIVHGASASARNIGSLQSASLSDGSYSESYTYDAVGRLSRRRIVAEGTHDYDYAYNAQGLLKSLQYPVSTNGYRFAIGFEYVQGRLTKILDSSSGAQIWGLTTMDAAGRAIDVRLGSGIQLLSGFDATTGQLESRTAGAGATTFQDLEYQWDDADRLISRTDGIQGGLTETFAYDALNRLDRSWRGGVLNLDVAYDALGNIKSKFEEGLGTFAYQYHATKKHAVTAAGLNTYTYDANGNMQSRNGTGTSWYSFNLPNLIGQAGGNSSRFWYGPDRQRWKQVATYSGATETTVYVGGLLEKVTKGSVTTYRHYVPTPAGASALYLRKSSGSPSAAMYYVLTDHLGSTDKIVDAAGTTVAAAESFSAFGRRRGITWSDSPTAAELTAIAATTRDGYTGHESLDSVGLIHMNGRVYDPAIGRFMSADPYVTSPYDAQGFNRYSYVRNNPLSLVDPSGFSPDDDRPPLLCDDGCVAWYLADFAYGYVPYEPNVFYGPYPLSRPGASPVPAQPPFVPREGRVGPDLSVFAGLVSDSRGATGCASAGRCERRSLPNVRFNDFVNFVAGSGDVLLALGTLSIADGAEFRRVTGVGTVNVHSKAYQAGFWGTVLASAGLARALVKPPAAAPGPPVANPVPAELARVVAGRRAITTLGRPGETDVFVVAAEDIAGMNSTQIAERLTIPQADAYTVIRFPRPESGVASPVFRENPGFVHGGRTRGGAREYVIPNGPIPPGAQMEVVGP